MSKELIGKELYDKDPVRCEHFYRMGKSYNYNNCCIKFFIEKAIGEIETDTFYIVISTGIILCPICSLELDHETIAITATITADDSKPLYYTTHPDKLKHSIE